MCYICGLKVSLPFVASRNGEMMSRRKNRKVSLAFGLSLLLSALFFLFDCFNPTDIAVWLFYLIPLLLTAYVAPRRITYLLLLICTLLIGLGHFASTPLGNPNVALLNRLIGVTVLWLSIVILLERTRAEEFLRESKRQYQDLVELSPETIYIQQEGKFVFINTAGLELFGAASSKDIVGKPLLDFLHPENRRPTEDRIRMEQERGGTLQSMEEQFLRLDGTPLEMEISAVPIEYHGKPALQVFARDITGRKQLEDQLRQSQKIEAVGRLAGGIAHDFNNLMTVIMGYVGLTKKRSGNPDHVSKGLDEIEKASTRATRLTQQLIAFSRKQILQPQILDVNQIVFNMEKMLRRLIGENIELVTIPTSDLGKVKADPGQIEQVIVNLALNARDAMPQGGRITIETENVDVDESFARESPGIPATACVKLLFRDNGIGMDEGTKAHIFEPYFTTKEVGKGVGLGLATVYGIIRQSGGNIQVESEPGQGSTFTILLPRVTETAHSTEPPELVLDAAPGEETIMVVEDEEPVLNLIRETLEDAGYNVMTASNGEEALALLSRNKDPIHLLLTDVVMPNIGGQSLAARVASRHPEIQTLFMTGYFDTNVDTTDYPLGRKPLIFKPFTPQELMSKIRQLLDE
jgi:two-component system cell cycle sensor histidine kinase/response regulator CckA